MRRSAPANLSPLSAAPPPPPADPSIVLRCIRCCASHEAAVRGPAEGQLQQWENSYSSGKHASGYLTSLVSVVDSANTCGGGGEHDRLLGAILLKNGIPKAFGAPLPESSNEEADATTLARLRQERAHVRSRLPTLLFRERNNVCALHLQLALSNVALFDFPHQWPTLLEDLESVASGQQCPDGADQHTVRLRAIKTLRLCLQSIRQRKIMVQKPKRGRRNPLIHMNDLGSIIGKAAQERKELHARACSVFLQLAEGIVNHSQAAIGGGGGSNAHVWQAECSLAVGYLKCMMDMIPMVEIDNVDTDPRTPVVMQLLQSLTQIFDAVKVYPGVNVPPTLQSIPSIQRAYTMNMDKIYRATLVCCISSVRSLAPLFATQVPSILPAVVEPIIMLDAATLHSMPVKRVMVMTGLVQTIMMNVLYDAKRKDAFGGAKNAVLAALMGKGAGGVGNDNTNLKDDPRVVEAQRTVTALLAESTIERLLEALVGKFLRLHSDEIEEWEDDSEGRYETDLAEKSLFEMDSPRHCGGALLLTLMNREPDRVAANLLKLTQLVNQHDTKDINSMLNREACYRALELCHSAMVGHGQRRLNFSEWYQTELRPILQTDMEVNSPVAMRAIQARAIQVVQAFSTSLKPEEFDLAFESIARLICSADLVTAFCAARCINHLALLHVKGTEESPHLLSVRKHSVVALGNAFSLAKRAESEECLRVTLMCVSALVEANGLYLEPVLQAIAEQLPSLWERARDSVPIHSCLLSVLTHLIMKLGSGTVENAAIQTVLFPLLDYCTDISIVNRADTLLEDGLRLWLVTVVSSRVVTMGQKLTNMLTRLETILTAGLEPHLSLKILQFNAILLGPQVVEPLAAVLRDTLMNLTSCIHSKQKGGGYGDAMDGGFGISQGEDRGTTTLKYALAALSFAEGLMQLFPDLGLSICAPTISKIILSLPRAVCQNENIAAPLLGVFFECFGRMLWMNPNCLDEIFASNPDVETEVAVVLEQYISSVKSVPMIAMLNAKVQKVLFVKQKGAALSLCSAVCRSPRVARMKGKDILGFTQALLKIESESKELLDVNVLAEAACGTTRKVVGDGPLGDSAARTKEILKSDPLLTVSLKEALENAQKAVTSL